MRVEHWPAWLYAIACVLALALVPMSAAGWIARDPLSAIPAVLLGLPWSIGLPWLGASESVALNLALLLLGMALNFGLLWALGTWLAARLRKRGAP